VAIAAPRQPANEPSINASRTTDITFV
jgi:hypothetical protein